jgi:hypothetical protein
LVMCSDTVVEWVRLPLVPVMVMVKVPVPAPLPLNVSVEVPVPPDETVTLAGLNVALTPEGSVPVESVMVPLKPLSEVIVIVVVVAPFLDIDRLEGEALMLKSGDAGAVTVML